MCPGAGPDPAEVFTVVRVTENRIALKSGYERYVGVNSAGELIGRAEAVGPREMWEPVFEEVRACLCVQCVYLCDDPLPNHVLVSLHCNNVKS